MKPKSLIIFCTVVLLLVFTAVGTLSGIGEAKKTDYDSIADKIVNYALEVKPGETVIISGTPAEMDILSALVVAVAKAGGNPTVQISIPEANKRAIMETSIEYLKITPTYGLMQMRAVDCFINTGSIQDPKLFADVPEEKLAATREASRPLNEAFRLAHFRSVSLGQTGGIPTKAYAESQGANYDEMLKMFWNAVDTDYKEMLAKAKIISKILTPGRKIKLTSTAGTNITFKVGNFSAKTNCGRYHETVSASGPAQVWLPAGEVYVCVDPTSATGKVVVPSTTFRGIQIKNLRMTFENGRISDLKADKNGELIKKSLDMSSGDKDVLSIVDIGLNPNSQPLEGANYYSWEMEGMISIQIGNNYWAGGDVESDIGLSFHLPNTTLEIDGKTVAERGKLKGEALKKK